MKTVKIVVALLVVVIASMGGVFAVEGFTTPIIDARIAAEANAALLEMYDGADGVEIITDTLPEDEVVTEVYSVTASGTQVGVVYKAEFTGYNPGVVALIGVNTTDNTVAGFSVLMESDTAGLGKDLLNDPLFAEQFVGLDVADVRDNGVDLTSGSTARITLSGVNAAVKKVLIYHGVNFLGEEAPIEETPEMIRDRVKETLFPGATFTDITSKFETPDVIVEVLETSDGGVFIEATFNGYAQLADATSADSRFVIGMKDGVILGFETLESTETPGLGYDLVFNAEFAAQYANADAEAIMNDGVDVVAGSTAAITLGAVNDSVSKVLGYYVVNWLGGEAPIEETPDMIQERMMSEMFPGATFEDVTYDYEITDYVWEMFEASTGGHVIVGIFNGYAPESLYIIGVKDGHILGYATLSSYETAGIGLDLVMSDEFAAQFTGLDIYDAIDSGVDLVAGSTASVTLNGVNASIADILAFYSNEVLGVAVDGPVVETPEMIQERMMETMFPGATFEDVTYDYDLGDNLWEMYEASTGGHAIVGIFKGYGTESLYIIGVNDQTVLGFATLSTGETPGIGYDLVMHEEFGAQFEGQSIDTIIDSGVDFVAGSTASITLNAVNSAVEEMLEAYKLEVLGIEPAPVVEVPAEMATYLEAMHSADSYTVESLTDLPEIIQNVYTAVDSHGDVTAVFYEIEIFNSDYAVPGYALVQVSPTDNSVVNINVYLGNSTYTTEYATGTGTELADIDMSSVVAELNGDGLTTSDLDSISGTTADYTFPSFIEGIQAALDYQTTNNIGGSN